MDDAASPLSSAGVFDPQAVLLAKVPGTWSTTRLKAVLRESNRRSRDGTEPLLSVTEHRGVVRRDLIVDEGAHLTRAASLEGYKIADVGDLVVNIMLAWKRGLGVSWEPGIVSPAYSVFRVRDNALDFRFLDYFIRSDEVVALLKSRSYGIVDSRLRIYPQALLSLEVPLPPLPTQKAIASFLDRETAKIDTLIEKKKRLLDLLEEKRTARIAEIVEGHPTDPNVRLRYLVDILPGYAFPSSAFTKSEDDMKLLRGTNVSPAKVDWAETVRWPADRAGAFERYRLREGDLVFGMDRPWISAGIRVATIRQTDLPALLVQRVARLRSGPFLLQDYLEIVLSSPQFRAYFDPILTGVSVPHISESQIGEFGFSLPSMERQREEVHQFRKQDGADRMMRRRLVESISLLQEYRTVLISAAVTGQIDVTDYEDSAA